MSHALSLPSEVAILLPQGEHGPALVTQFTVAMGQEGQVVGELRLRTTRQQACSAFRYCSSQLNRRDAHMVSPELRPTLSSQWTTRPSHECRNTFAALADTAPAGFGLAVLQRAQERGLLDCFRPSEQEPTPWDALCMVPDLARMGALRPMSNKPRSFCHARRNSVASQQRLGPSRKVRKTCAS